jgi:Mn-containing catalase
VFFHDQRLLYHVRPDRPDPAFAALLQEVLGGQWGELTAAMSYLFQAWSCRGPAKYRDLLLDTGTEELAHVELLATMIARLLDDAPLITLAQTTISAGPSPVHAIVGGPALTDAVGYPWTGRYAVTSGNLLADFRFNLTAESQNRLQLCRLYDLTDDAGVRDLLSFLIARDTMHQNQWLAAIAEVEADGLEQTPVPSSCLQNPEHGEFAYQYLAASTGVESARGRWADGPAPDKRGVLSYAKAEPLDKDRG